MIKCSICKKFKDVSYFHKNRAHKRGYSSDCKVCKKLLAQKYYKKHKKQIIEKTKCWRKANLEQHKLNCSKWRKNNRDKCRKIDRRHHKKHQLSDHKYRMIKALRSSLNGYIKGKIKSTKELLGCTLDELKIHLEKQFQLGMTWDNYGRNGWHIDHIFPLSKADLTNKFDLERVCHYTNLQPLWAKDNLRKHNKILE